MATSREFLDLPGEQVVRVRSLAVPEAESTVDELVLNPSVQLVATGYRQLASKSPWTEELRAVGEICRRLEGSHSPSSWPRREQPRWRQQRSLPISMNASGSSPGVVGAVERHQTLRATVDWSYSLLGPRERTLFDR